MCDPGTWQNLEIVALGERLLVLDHAGGRFAELRLCGFAPVDKPVDNPVASAAASDKTSEFKTRVLIKTASEFKTLDAVQTLRQARNRRHYVRRKAGLCGTGSIPACGQTIKTQDPDFKTNVRVEGGKDDFPSERHAGEACQPKGRARQVLMDQALRFIRRHRLLREAEITALVERITEAGRWERYLDRGTGAFLAPDREFFEQLFPMVQAERRQAATAEPATVPKPQQGWLKLPISSSGRPHPPADPDRQQHWRETG